MKLPSTNLVHLLIGKSIVETLLVGALAVFAFLNVVPPFFHGWGEATESGIVGWAVNNAAPYERVEVQLFIDGKFSGSAIANEARPDVHAAGWSVDEWHGYKFPISSLKPGNHVARVYALHQSGGATRQSLQLLGNPISFTVDPDGKLRPTAPAK